MLKAGASIVGICMLTKESPYRHFNDEDDGVNIPYLYNMMRDTKKEITRELKVAVLLLNAVKNDIQNNERLWEWLNPTDPQKPTNINIDIIHTNEHAINFYKKNGFVTYRTDLYEMKDTDDNIFKFKMMQFKF